MKTKNDDTIVHYGVLGMKWGVRKGGSSEGKRRTASKDHTTSRKLQSRKKTSLSNRELEKVNRRLQLERTNDSLRSSRSFVSKALAVGGTMTSAYALVNSPPGKKAVSFVKNAIESESMKRAYRRAMGG